MQTSVPLSIVVIQPGVAWRSVPGYDSAHDDFCGFGVWRAEIADGIGKRRSDMTSLLQNVRLGRKRPVVGQLCQLKSEPVQLIRSMYLYGGSKFD